MAGPPKRGETAGLTVRQHRFVTAYMKSRVASTAAREAGYGKSMAACATRKILRRPAVAAAIAKIEAKLDAKTVYTVASMSRDIEGDIVDAKKDKQHGAVAQGRTHLSKLHKLIGPDEVFVIDLRGALEAARQRVASAPAEGPPMIDITPSAAPEPRDPRSGKAITAKDVFGD